MKLAFLFAIAYCFLIGFLIEEVNLFNLFVIASVGVFISNFIYYRSR